MVDVAAAEDDRTTAQGLFVYADSYLAAADGLWRQNLAYSHAESPIRFALYHAAELYLKAFLRATGMTVQQLRKLEHKFSKLLPAAEARGLNLSAEARHVFEYGQQSHDIIEARYIRNGLRRPIPTVVVARATKSVRAAVREHPARLGHIILRNERLGEFGAELEAQWQDRGATRERPE